MLFGARALQADRRVEDLEERAGIRVGLGEAEVAAERPHLADAHVRDVGFHSGHGGEPLAHARIALEDAVGRGGADPQRAVVVEADTGQPRDGLDVHQVVVVGESFLHDQEQLGAAGVEPRRVAGTREELRGLGDRGRLAQLEGGQHGMRPTPRGRPSPQPSPWKGEGAE